MKYISSTIKKIISEFVKINFSFTFSRVEQKIIMKFLFITEVKIKFTI